MIPSPIKLFFLVLFLWFPLAKSQQKEDSLLSGIQKYLYDNPDIAITEVQKLIKAQPDPNKKIKYLLFLSKAYTAKRNTDESYKTLLKAQELVKNSTDLESKIDVLLLIAIQYQQMELFNKSFETLDEADQLCQKISESNKKKWAWLGKSFAVRGMIYKSQGNLEIALQKFSSAIHYLEKAEQNIPNINNTSILDYNIGYIYLNRDQFSTAENYFKKSILYAQKSNAKSLEAYAMKGLAENYTLQNKNEKALFFLKQAAQKSAAIGDLLLDEGIYKGLAENYLSIGKFTEYQENNEKYKRIQFEREQGELKSISSLISQLELNKGTQIKTLKTNHLIINLCLIIFISCLSGLFLVKSILKYRKNKIYKDKLGKLMHVYFQ